MSSSEFWMHTGRLQGMMGAVVTGRPVESAWLLHSERKWMFPWSNTHGKHGPSQDGPNKVRKYEKSRRVEKEL